MRPRVLFVDDEPALLDMLRRQIMVRGKDIEASFAPGGEKALALLGRAEFDVVVADLRMPDMDGAELLRETARLHPTAARLLLTGQYDARRALEYARTAHQLLLKPVPVGDLLATVRNLAELRSFITDPVLAGLVGRLTSLPVAPEAYLRMTRALASETVSLHDVGCIVADDPALTATILRLCNSSFFGLSREIRDPCDAVRLLGTTALKSFVLFHELFRTIDPQRPPLLDIDALWHHCLHTAHCTRLIVRMETGDADMAETGFLAGLLHDIGLLVLAENFPDSSRDVRQEAERTGAPLHEVERAAFGAGHAELGAYIMGLWGIPPEIAWAVAFHHDPMRRVEGGFGLLAMLHAADALEREFSPGDGITREMDQAFLALTGYLERLPAWREACAASLREVTA